MYMTITKPSLQLVRNATLVINYAGLKLLLDPCFAAKGTIGSFAGIVPNPTVEMPLSVDVIMQDIDAVLVTHTHPDHFDDEAKNKISKDAKLFIQPSDIDFFTDAGFSNAEVVAGTSIWQGITITRTDGQHGSGEILERMGIVSGFVLQAEGYPTLYIAGDTILTTDVIEVVNEYNPDYIVVNSGGAAFPGFEAHPILMNEQQVVQLMSVSLNATTIAVHMEALDHCKTTRSSLTNAVDIAGYSARLIVPKDGDVVLL